MSFNCKLIAAGLKHPTVHAVHEDRLFSTVSRSHKGKKDCVAVHIRCPRYTLIALGCTLLKVVDQGSMRNSRERYLV